MVLDKNGYVIDTNKITKKKIIKNKNRFDCATY